jgi:RimJ/RimL family protein N-acetyltransferase
MSDLDAMVAMDLDPEVHRYIYAEAPDPDRHRSHLRAGLAEGWPLRGGIWTVEWRDQPGFLGWCGLFPLEESALIEIGYRYVRSAWGQGIGTEAARAVLDHGFRVLRFDPIVAVTYPENARSRRLLENIGLAAAGTAFHYGRWLAHYRLSRDDYLGGGPRQMD